MPTHSLKITSTYDTGTEKYVRKYTNTQTAGQYTHIKEVIPDSSTDLEVNLEIALATLKLFMMTADGDILVEANDGTTPTDLWNLTSTNHVIWADGQNAGEDTQGRPITANITTNIFVTNSSGSAVTLEIHALEDPTP